MDTSTISEFRVLTLKDEEMIRLSGPRNEYLKLIESAFSTPIYVRGNEIRVRADAPNSSIVAEVLDEILTLVRGRSPFGMQDMKFIVRTAKQELEEELKAKSSGKPKSEQMGKPSESGSEYIVVPSKRGRIYPRTPGQKRYLNAVRKHDIVFAIGPAGTGKTYLAMAMAVEALTTDKVGRIILVRPAVEAGEKLGFLPGDLYEKVSPYLRPLYDALYDMLDPRKVQEFIDRGIIEVAPLAYMRGRTLNDSFIILDEAQNTTSEQMKMFLTRLGFDSKTVITGDVTQIDLPTGKGSGLVQAEAILKLISGISFVYFSGEDVVRHELVQEIIKAYAELKIKEDSGNG
ncbi:MAG: PhoH family protein, partial [bacterium]|nr:PhoH family protein [bacterium]